MMLDGEYFGAGLVKAYRLEKEQAGHPRLVVGDGLVAYLRTCGTPHGPEIELQLEARLAAKCTTFLARDEDQKWILDYAGKGARDLLSAHPSSEIFANALAFAREARGEFQKDPSQRGVKLFERYSKLVRYLDARAPFWT
jgi:hypothetical protein